MPEFNRWFADNAEHLRYDYDTDLNSNSIVIDLGLYKGTFAEAIAKKYDCNVYGFEPIKEFYNQSLKKLKIYPKVKLFNYAVGATDRLEKISLEMDGSSIFSNGKIEIQIRSFKSIIEDLQIGVVDLLKINTEGCEYEILDHLIETNLISIFKNIQVQFHDFVPNAVEKRNKIREALIKTHKETYSYEFVWENHRLL